MKSVLCKNLFGLCKRHNYSRKFFKKFCAIGPALFIMGFIYIGSLQAAQCNPEQSVTNGLPLLTAMNGTGKLEPCNNNHFTFAVFGDSQGGEKARAIISGIFTALHDHRTKRPAFAFCLGDIVKGKDPQDPAKHIKQKFADYLKLAKTARIPVFNAPGNHEMDDKDDIPSKRMHAIYEAMVAPSYGAFNYGNSRFIGLNTENIPPKGTLPPPDNMEFSYMSDAQLNQLGNDLNANRDKTHIFIMMHYPMKPQRAQDSLNPASLKKLNKIIEKYNNISYILASHEHLYYNPQDPDNITSVAPFKSGEPTRYLISGGAGASIYTPEEKGGFHHYLIFEVDGDNINVKINRVDG